MTTVPAKPLLWLSFMGTPVIWLIHFLLVYLFNEQTCSAAASGFPGISGTGFLLGLTVVFALFSCAISLLAYRVSQHAKASRPSYDDFLPRLGFVTGLLFSFILLAELIPIAILGAC